MRLDAYYYGFDPTGVEAIDRILSAIACAGKAYHLTEDWQEQCEPSSHFFGAQHRSNGSKTPLTTLRPN